MGAGKLIKDPVHGYIVISGEYCRLFVDTPIFQRLRLIEQTSMRWLFPGARHDRFIHSLGVFYLASRIYDSIKENVKDEKIKEVLEDTCLKTTFLVAALMHDCGHSPFSHTLEKFYNKCTDGSWHNSAFRELRKLAPAKDACDLDFTKITAKPPAPHEAMSAYVLLSEFSEAMDEVGAAPGLAARMITGASYRKPSNLKDMVANVFIELVNGNALDVDKLDYIIRDTWASGVKNTAIDVDRLIRGATIVRVARADGRDEIHFAFKKSSISVVQSVIDARNYLYNWIYGHHTVLYYSHLLEQAVIKFSKKYAQKYHVSNKSVLKRMFSPKMFHSAVSLSKNSDLKVCLVSDGDILHLIKMFVPEEPDYVAYSSHKPRHIPLWKTAADYRKCIDEQHQFALNDKVCLEKIREHFDLSPDECFACNDMTMKIYDLKDDDIEIDMSNGEVMSITDVAHLPKHPHLTEQNKASLFYIYLDKNRSNLKQKIIDFINRQPVGKTNYQSTSSRRKPLN